MQDYGQFCYLGVQKTGSTFISRTLNEVSRLPLLPTKKRRFVESASARDLPNVLASKLTGNRRIGGIFRKDCFYFNSIRNPFDYYASLYNYGCDGRGGLAKNIRNSGFGNLYDNTSEGFLSWISFVMDPQNARYCEPEYANSCSEAVGFFTYRFLRMSFVDPLGKLKKLRNPEDAQGMYSAFNICEATIRQERLNSDLTMLLNKQLRDHVSDTAHDLISQSTKVNASVSGVVSGSFLENSVVAQRVLDRDRLIFDGFYPHGTS